MQILHGNGFGGFTLGQNLVTESQCNNVEVNDLNKDGNLDIVLAGAGSENESGLFISSYLGDGTGKFTAKQSIPLGEGSTGEKFRSAISMKMATSTSPFH